MARAELSWEESAALRHHLRCLSKPDLNGTGQVRGQSCSLRSHLFSRSAISFRTRATLYRSSWNLAVGTSKRYADPSESFSCIRTLGCRERARALVEIATSTRHRKSATWGSQAPCCWATQSRRPLAPKYHAGQVPDQVLGDAELLELVPEGVRLQAGGGRRRACWSSVCMPANRAPSRSSGRSALTRRRCTASRQSSPAGC